MDKKTAVSMLSSHYFIKKTHLVLLYSGWWGWLIKIFKHWTFKLILFSVNKVLLSSNWRVWLVHSRQLFEIALFVIVAHLKSLNYRAQVCFWTHPRWTHLFCISKDGKSLLDSPVNWKGCSVCWWRTKRKMSGQDSRVLSCILQRAKEQWSRQFGVCSMVCRDTVHWSYLPLL